jgi:hypothetical protein
MANKDNLIKLVAQKLGPDKLNQMVEQAAQAIGQDPDVTPEVINKIIEMFEFVAENPDEYQSVVQQAIQTGALDQGDLPAEFDPVIIAVILLAFYGLRDRIGGEMQMAKGGLASMAQRVQSAGRNGDTMLAHITPQEAALLERRGGLGSMNPSTGLPEYGFFKKLKKIVKAVAPIAVSFIPGIGPVAAAALAAGSTAVLGGNLKESLLAGLGGALGTQAGQGFAGNIGQSLNQSLPGLSSLGLSNQVLGSGVLGGVSGAIAGKNPLTSALTAGLTSYAAPKIADSLNAYVPGSEGVTADAVRGANISAQMGGNPLVGAGTGAIGSLAGNLMNDGTLLGPQAAVDSMGNKLPPLLGETPNPTDLVTLDNGMTTQYQDMVPGSNYELAQTPVVSGTVGAPAPTGALSQVAQTTATPSTGFGFGDVAKIGMLGSLIAGKTPTQAQQAIQDSALTAQQKEGMLRSLTNYTFSPNMTTFPTEGTAEYNKLMSDLSKGIEQTYSAPAFTEVKAKGGRTKRQPQGALSQMSYAVEGPGTGRSDSIDARLSDGEYVIDAETVALLGNGSTRAGAAMLDQMRQGIRQQKGKALAKGKFSPDAKSPLAYMKGGLR